MKPKGNKFTVLKQPAHAASRNGFSHANRIRNADMAEALFWNDSPPGYIPFRGCKAIS